MKKKLHNRHLWLLVLFLSGLLFRAIFLLYGAKVYYSSAPSIHLNGDSHSYMRPFENLLHTGHYTFDFLVPDAAFGRLPGYPFFYGLHYMVFGPELAPLATAWSQVFLDSGGILLMFGILRRSFPESLTAPLIAAGLYALYPFIVIWMPVIGTEALSTTLCLLWLYCLLGYRPTVAYTVGLGMLTAVIFFVREYLGILLPITAFYLLVDNRTMQSGRFRLPRALAWRSVLLLGLGFSLLYIWWPVRNYVSLGRVMFTKPKTAGYATYGPDMDSYRSWVQAWTNDENPWIDRVLHDSSVTFPAQVFADEREQAEAQRLVKLAQQCGLSFYLTRTGLQGNPVYRDTVAMRHHAEYQAMKRNNCAQQISEGFTQLRISYRQRHPIAYFLDVPAQNLYKAFFKSGTAQNKNQPVTGKALLLKILFGYRSLLVITGLVGLLVFWRQRALWPVALFAGFMYLFISFILRGLEMRYLIQADVMLLVPAAYLLGNWADTLARRFGYLIPVIDK